MVRKPGPPRKVRRRPRHESLQPRQMLAAHASPTTRSTTPSYGPAVPGSEEASEDLTAEQLDAIYAEVTDPAAETGPVIGNPDFAYKLGVLDYTPDNAAFDRSPSGEPISTGDRPPTGSYCTPSGAYVPVVPSGGLTAAMSASSPTSSGTTTEATSSGTTTTATSSGTTSQTSGTTSPTSGSGIPISTDKNPSPPSTSSPTSATSQTGFSQQLDQAVDDSHLEDISIRVEDTMPDTGRPFWPFDNDPGAPGFDCDDYGTAMDNYLEETLLNGHSDAEANFIKVVWNGHGHVMNHVEVDGEHYIIDAQTGLTAGPFSTLGDAEAGVRQILDARYPYKPTDDVVITEMDTLPTSEPAPFYEDPDLLQDFIDELNGVGVTDPSPYLPDGVGPN